MRYSKILALSILFVVILSVYAVSIFGQVSITTTEPTPLTYHVFYVADLGLEGRGVGNRDITISFAAAALPSQAITVEVWDVNANEIIVDGQTSLHPYANIVGNYYIGQIDDKFGGEFDVNDQYDVLYDKVLATGRLPRGIFRIDVSLTPGPSNTASIQVIIAPPFMQPLYPVDVQTNRAVLDFRWISNIFRQELHIFRDPFGNKEVLQGSRLSYSNLPDPVGEWNPRMQNVSGAVVAPFLEDGEIYYWQVTGYRSTSHGDERTESVLTAFQYFEEMMRMEYIGLSDADKSDIKDLLIELLQKIVNNRAARSIEPYDVNRVVLDNSPVTREEIITILQKLIDGEITATSVSLQ